MLEGAYAHIFGKLNEDIIIDRASNGQRYGILSVSVTHHIDKRFTKVSNKNNIFQVIIWSEFILFSQRCYLKKGAKVYIYGELSTTDQIVWQYGKPCNAIIMEVNERFKVEVLA